MVFGDSERTGIVFSRRGRYRDSSDGKAKDVSDEDQTDVELNSIIEDAKQTKDTFEIRRLYLLKMFMTEARRRHLIGKFEEVPKPGANEPISQDLKESMKDFEKEVMRTMDEHKEYKELFNKYFFSSVIAFILLIAWVGTIIWIMVFNHVEICNKLVETHEDGPRANLTELDNAFCGSRTAVTFVHNIIFGLITAVVVSELRYDNDDETKLRKRLSPVIGHLTLHKLQIQLNSQLAGQHYGIGLLFRLKLWMIENSSRVFVITWLVFGLVCLGYGMLVREVMAGALYATGQTWLGVAITASYSYFGVAEEADDPSDSGDGSAEEEEEEEVVFHPNDEQQDPRTSRLTWHESIPTGASRHSQDYPPRKIITTTHPYTSSMNSHNSHNTPMLASQSLHFDLPPGVPAPTQPDPTFSETQTTPPATSQSAQNNNPPPKVLAPTPAFRVISEMTTSQSAQNNNHPPVVPAPTPSTPPISNAHRTPPPGGQSAQDNGDTTPIQPDTTNSGAEKGRTDLPIDLTAPDQDDTQATGNVSPVMPDL